MGILHGRGWEGVALSGVTPGAFLLCTAVVQNMCVGRWKVQGPCGVGHLHVRHALPLQPLS